MNTLFLLIAALCVFIIVAVICFLASSVSLLTIIGLVCIGLAIFVAAHLPIP